MDCASWGLGKNVWRMFLKLSGIFKKPFIVSFQWPWAWIFLLISGVICGKTRGQGISRRSCTKWHSYLRKLWTFFQWFVRTCHSPFLLLCNEYLCWVRSEKVVPMNVDMRVGCSSSPHNCRPAWTPAHEDGPASWTQISLSTERRNDCPLSLRVKAKCSFSCLYNMLIFNSLFSEIRKLLPDFHVCKKTSVQV